MNKVRFFPLAVALLSSISPALLLADADDAPAGKTISVSAFGLLNERSKYFQDWFPEPFRVEDTAVDNELKFDWEHDEGKQSRADQITAEIQKSVGIVTFEIQAPYVISTGPDHDDTEDASHIQRTEGFGDIELAARVPIHQFVSSTGFFDNSVGLNVEVGMPTNTRFGKNTEIGPGIFDDLAIGEHFSLQALFSLASLVGPTRGGRDSFEYGLAFGYVIEDEEVRLPRIERLIPSVELVGETTLDGANIGHNALTGTVGLRFEFKPIGRLQPQFGIGYVFPVDKGGSEEIRWGVITGLVVEF